MEQVDSPSYDWYHDEGQDLHQRDFIFLARMQTARRMQQQVERFQIATEYWNDSWRRGHSIAATQMLRT